jgi:3-oxoacyl-[acyl-carrier protein] reductase
MNDTTSPPRTLITGGTRGIGAAVARRLQRDGHEVVALGRTSSAASPAPGVRVDHADVSVVQAVAAAFSRVNEDRRGLTGLVVSAGIWEPSPIEADVERVAAQHRRVMEINVIGAVNAVAAFLAHRRPGPASIVLVGSTAGQRGEAGHAAYAASKAALMGLCKSWAAELGLRGIRVNVCAPGWVDTEMTAPTVGDPAKRAAIEAAIPRGVMANADDVAGPIAFLLSEDSRHVTGSVLSVNGGGVLASF